MYQVGDKIVHPMHGAGSVDEIVERTIDGQTETYYALRLVLERVVLYIPVRTSGALGVRPVCSAEAAQELLGRLPALEIEADGNWNRRYRENMDRLRSGDLLEVAGVVKGLTRPAARAVDGREEDAGACEADPCVGALACARPRPRGDEGRSGGTALPALGWGRLRGARQGSALHPAEGSALHPAEGSALWTPAPARRAAGLRPAPGPARAAPKGLAPLESRSRLRAGRGRCGLLPCCFFYWLADRSAMCYDRDNGWVRKLHACSASEFLGRKTWFF